MDVVSFGGSQKSTLTDDSITMTISSVTDGNGGNGTKIIVAAAALGGLALLVYLIFKGA